MIEEYPASWWGAEGIIAIDAALQHELPIPVVAVAGHRRIPGVTNVVLDDRRAAELPLRHLYQLGHRHTAFMPDNRSARTPTIGGEVWWRWLRSLRSKFIRS